MRIFVFAAIFLCGVGASAQLTNQNHPSAFRTHLNGWFGKFDPRQEADDTRPGELAVHKLLLANDSWCSAVMIGPQWAVTAAHCITGRPRAIDFYRDNWLESTIRVDHSWAGRYYGKFWRAGSIRFLYQDYGFVHLESAAPKWVTFAQIAQPNELYIGEPAKTVGFPLDRFGGDTKVRSAHCGVRRLIDDAILSDCAVSKGSSGGALFVKTRLGIWKLGGIASTEEGGNPNFDGSENMVRGGPYSDALANHFVNITYYSGHIAQSIESYDGESLPSLDASLTLPVQCLTQFTNINWTSITANEIKTCEDVETKPQLDCLFRLFAAPDSVNAQSEQHCLSTP